MTTKEKQLTEKLLLEKLQRLSGKKVMFKESTGGRIRELIGGLKIEVENLGNASADVTAIDIKMLLQETKNLERKFEQILRGKGIIHF